MTSRGHGVFKGDEVEEKSEEEEKNEGVRESLPAGSARVGRYSLGDAIVVWWGATRPLNVLRGCGLSLETCLIVFFEVLFLESINQSIPELFVVERLVVLEEGIRAIKSHRIHSGGSWWCGRAALQSECPHVPAIGDTGQVGIQQY